ncbi:hypothetical protein [Thalassomonas sp. RHCl1]|uniref:hypothetical protein n=1 Tax=Thalassomonas sp. RHCl1 TaxID=2995320 RepID=UPI00248BA2BB|nr:hypothetical protein [Thalassomonas sp. RHCl1]
MSEFLKAPALKEINANKRKLNWGEVPAIYHMVSSSVGELDGILTHGFDSSYKHLLNRDTWNMDLLGGYTDKDGNPAVKIKPQISLKHVFNEMGYELHCFPMIQGERLDSTLLKNPWCPFLAWIPETMRRLFRINSLPAFIIYSMDNGDEADVELIKYAFLRVDNLIDILRGSFDIIEIDGFSIAEFYRDIERQKANDTVNEIRDIN